MAKFFTYSDRHCPIQFFEEEPINVTLFIGDELDRRIMESGAMIGEADKLNDLEKRCAMYRQAVELVIGAEKTGEILARADNLDSFSILEVWHHVSRAVHEQKVKNLMASAR